MRLMPGLIYAGTPAGVGAIGAGDLVSGGFHGLGEIEITIVCGKSHRCKENLLGHNQARLAYIHRMFDTTSPPKSSAKVSPARALMLAARSRCASGLGAWRNKGVMPVANGLRRPDNGNVSQLL